MIEKFITTVGTLLGLPVNQTVLDIASALIILGASLIGIFLALCVVCGVVGGVFAAIESAVHDAAARKNHR